jgi:hypothetical protein
MHILQYFTGAWRIIEHAAGGRAAMEITGTRNR